MDDTPVLPPPLPVVRVLMTFDVMPAVLKPMKLLVWNLMWFGMNDSICQILILHVDKSLRHQWKNKEMAMRN